MAALTTFPLVIAGTAPTFVAASTSDTAEYGSGSNTFAVYKNGDAGPHTVTITVPGNTSYGQPNPDPAYVVAAGGERWIPLKTEYANGVNLGRATLTLDGATSVTVAIVRVG